MAGPFKMKRSPFQRNFLWDFFKSKKGNPKKKPLVTAEQLKKQDERIKKEKEKQGNTLNQVINQK